MNTINKIAITSGLSIAMLAGSVFAAPTPSAQNAANNAARAVAKMVNDGKEISCYQAAIQIGKAAKLATKSPQATDIQAAITAAANTAKIGGGVSCITPEIAARASSISMGGSLATSGGFAGSRVLMLVGGSIAAVALISELSDDDDDDASPSS